MSEIIDSVDHLWFGGLRGRSGEEDLPRPYSTFAATARQGFEVLDPRRPGNIGLDGVDARLEFALAGMGPVRCLGDVCGAREKLIGEAARAMLDVYARECRGMSDSERFAFEAAADKTVSAVLSLYRLRAVEMENLRARGSPAPVWGFADAGSRLAWKVLAAAHGELELDCEHLSSPLARGRFRPGLRLINAAADAYREGGLISRILLLLPITVYMELVEIDGSGRLMEMLRREWDGPHMRTSAFKDTADGADLEFDPLAFAVLRHVSPKLYEEM